VSLLDYEEAFVRHTGWNKQLTAPYFVRSSEKLVNLFAGFTVKGMTISAPGFYGPQGRVLRLPLADSELNTKIESFRFNNECITNFEMESSAIAGLSLLLGHEAVTICCIIANRLGKTALVDYKSRVREMTIQTFDKLQSLTI